MFDAAKAQDEKIGNGGFELGMKGKPSDLPTCRNDLEFEFVVRACGYGEDNMFSSGMGDRLRSQGSVGI